MYNVCMCLNIVTVRHMQQRPKLSKSVKSTVTLECFGDQEILRALCMLKTRMLKRKMI